MPKHVHKPAPMTRTFKVRVYECANSLSEKVRPMEPFRVVAASRDEARRKAKAELSTAGRRLRTLSSAQERDTLLAYVEPLPTPRVTRSYPR